MKCPFCGKEMRFGYLQGYKGVGFSEKIHGSLSLWMFKGDFGKKTTDSDSVYSARFQLRSRLLL